jgi:hypothetical protein
LDAALVTRSEGRDAVYESTEHEIGEEGERDRHDDDAGDVNTMKDDVLIDSIEDRRDDEYFADMVPSFLQQSLAGFRLGDECPEIWLAAFGGCGGSWARWCGRGSYPKLSE